MLQVELSSDIAVYKSYSDAISFLAFNTINRFKGKIIKTVDGNDTMDVSQVCCAMCEKTLGNELRMFFAPNEGSIAIVQDSNNEEFEIHRREVTSNYLGKNLKDFLLLCGECTESFRTSIYGIDKSEIERDGKKTKDYFSGQLRKTSELPIENYEDLFDVNNYIFPNRTVEWVEELDDGMNSEVKKSYTASECFVYTKRVAWVRYLEQGEIETDFRSIDEAFESLIFVEPNPNLPEPIRIRALNTIRLFKLNGLYYDYTGDGYHAINYVVSENQIPYDDLRLLGRNKALKRAQTARNQLKNARDLFADKDLMTILTEQQKIIMELNGYRSTWAEVFNNGDDPEGLAGLFGLPTPVPSGPPITFENHEASEINRLKDQLVDLENKQQAADIIYREMRKSINILNYENRNLAEQIGQIALNREELLEFINDLVLTIDDYEDAKIMGKKREIKLARKEGIIEKVIRPVKSSSRVLRGVRTKMVNILNHQVTLVN